jgi:hypothetical protein
MRTPFAVMKNPWFPAPSVSELRQKDNRDKVGNQLVLINRYFGYYEAPRG